MIRIIVLQTIASNLGSMLTPIGNPQNLYLFSLSGMSLGDFISLMLPYTLLSLIGLLAACIVLIDRKAVAVKVGTHGALRAAEKGKAIVYFLLFLFALTRHNSHNFSLYSRSSDSASGFSDGSQDAAQT